MASQVEVEAFLADLPRPHSQVLDGWLYWECPGFLLVQTGMGLINTACAVHSFLRHFSPSCAIQIGLSGAHQERLKVGQIILGNETVDFAHHTKHPDGRIEPLPHLIQRRERVERITRFPSHAPLSQKIAERLEQAHLSYERGVIGGADQFNRNPFYIRKIQEAFGTTCEDMESTATAQVAYRWGVPFVSVRVISNNELTCEGQTNTGQPFPELAFRVLGKIGQALWENNK